MEEIAGVKLRFKTIFDDLKSKSLPKTQNQVNLFGLNAYPYPKNLEKSGMNQRQSHRQQEMDPIFGYNAKLMNTISKQQFSKTSEDHDQDSSLQRAPSVQSQSKFHHVTNAPSNHTPCPSSPQPSQLQRDAQLTSILDTYTHTPVREDGMSNGKSQSRMSAGAESRESPVGSLRKRTLLKVYQKVCDQNQI